MLLLHFHATFPLSLTSPIIQTCTCLCGTTTVSPSSNITLYRPACTFPHTLPHTSQDIEISVQCDVQVFAWLLQWATAKHTAATPAANSVSAAAAAAGASVTAAAPCLTSANVLCILISSNFLEVRNRPGHGLCASLSVQSWATE